jgi:hypothetical protein
MNLKRLTFLLLLMASPASTHKPYYTLLHP